MAIAVETESPRKPRFAESDAAPRIWLGMNFGGWLRLLARNRFAVERRFWPVAIAVTAASLFNTLWSWVAAMTHGWRSARVSLDEPPIFVLGHWRSGTTLVHELLGCDPRFACPSTYACFAPNHFVRSEWVVRWLDFMVPSRRPMDNMPAGWKRPQEDEFALCNLGLPSPYLSIAFPNHPPQDQEYLTLEGVTPAARQRWKRKLIWFLRQLTFRHRKRLVLKSPLHTARIRLLLEMFPDARFLHIVRDPLAVFPSSVHLWKSLCRRDALQTPTHEGLEERVFSTFNRMYAAFERDRALIPPGHLCEVRYEDLVADPLATMEQAYARLGLGDFAMARPAVVAYLAAIDGYQANRYELSAELKDQIARRWGWFSNRYGYSYSGR